MSEDREQLVALDLSDVALADAPTRVQRWLRDQGWLGEPCTTDFLYKRSTTYTLGPAGRARCADAGPDDTVSVDPGPQVWSGPLDEVGPVCPRCGHDEGEEVDEELTTAWLENREEPVHRCPRCGWTGLLGSWDLTDASAVGAVAVVLDGGCSLEVKDALLAELRSGFGGRWAHVHLHL